LLDILRRQEGVAASPTETAGAQSHPGQTQGQSARSFGANSATS